MANEWVSVADTAIKIGLGAVIAAISAYSLAVFNHKKEMARKLYSEKISILKDYALKIDESAEIIGTVFQNLSLLKKGLTVDTTYEIEFQRLTSALSKSREAKTLIALLGVDKLTKLSQASHKNYIEHYILARDKQLKLDFDDVHKLTNDQSCIRKEIEFELSRAFNTINT